MSKFHKNLVRKQRNAHCVKTYIRAYTRNLLSLHKIPYIINHSPFVVCIVKNLYLKLFYADASRNKLMSPIQSHFSRRTDQMRRRMGHNIVHPTTTSTCSPSTRTAPSTTASNRALSTNRPAFSDHHMTKRRRR